MLSDESRRALCEVFHRLTDREPVVVEVEAALCAGLPEALTGRPNLMLGHGLRPAIPDLDADADGITGTLHFGGVPHLCAIPWEALVSLIGAQSGSGLVRTVKLTEHAGEGKGDGKPRGALRLVRNEPAPAPAPRGAA